MWVESVKCKWGVFEIEMHMFLYLCLESPWNYTKIPITLNNTKRVNITSLFLISTNVLKMFGFSKIWYNSVFVFNVNMKTHAFRVIFSHEQRFVFNIIKKVHAFWVIFCQSWPGLQPLILKLSLVLVLHFAFWIMTTLKVTVAAHMRLNIAATFKEALLALLLHCFYWDICISFRVKLCGVSNIDVHTFTCIINSIYIYMRVGCDLDNNCLYKWILFAVFIPFALFHRWFCQWNRESKFFLDLQCVCVCMHKWILFAVFIPFALFHRWFCQWNRESKLFLDLQCVCVCMYACVCGWFNWSAGYIRTKWHEILKHKKMGLKTH